MHGTNMKIIKLGRMLAKYNIKSVAIPPRKIASYMPPTKDAPGLKLKS
jgi:hypothetical protein